MIYVIVIIISIAIGFAMGLMFVASIIVFDWERRKVDLRWECEPPQSLKQYFKELKDCGMLINYKDALCSILYYPGMWLAQMLNRRDYLKLQAEFIQSQQSVN